ncbi:MAG: hypothetical protein LBF56_02935 [Holosporales bacterium]|nr:hypothetical protein [Holosporales bacterium]
MNCFGSPAFYTKYGQTGTRNGNLHEFTSYETNLKFQAAASNTCTMEPPAPARQVSCVDAVICSSSTGNIYAPFSCFD